MLEKYMMWQRHQNMHLLYEVEWIYLFNDLKSLPYEIINEQFGLHATYLTSTSHILSNYYLNKRNQMKDKN